MDRTKPVVEPSVNLIFFRCFAKKIIDMEDFESSASFREIMFCVDCR